VALLLGHLDSALVVQEAVVAVVDYMVVQHQQEGAVAAVDF
jgi:hypothetical protein